MHCRPSGALPGPAGSSIPSTTLATPSAEHCLVTVSGIASAVTEAITAPGERAVTAAVVREHNLNEPAYSRILEMLGWTPTLSARGVGSALWSGQCAYAD